MRRRHWPNRRGPEPGAGAPRRVCVLIATNVGGTWAVPTVRSLVAAGHEVLVIVRDEPGALAAAMRDAGATVVQRAFVPPWRPAWFRTWRVLRADVVGFGADTLLYYLYLSAFYGRAIGSLRGIRRVHFMVSPLVLETPPLSWIERFLLPLDSSIIAGSDAIRVALNHLGRERDITVVYPPIDTARIAPPSSATRLAARRRLGVEPDAFVAVMVAYCYAPKRTLRLGEPLKGHALVVDAWVRTAPAAGDHLFVVGGGFRQEGCELREAFVSGFDHDRNPTVHFIDHTDDVDLYYAAADVSIAPSTTENLGAAAEASLAGVPTIATRVGGFPEIVIPEYSGWLLAERTAGCISEALVRAREAKRTGRLGDFSVHARELAASMLDQQRNADASASVVIGDPIVTPMATLEHTRRDRT
jgi:glycosyltransferase involved in cell wall biosynthesis